jgi:iron complex transport system substrate-binding protein
VRRNTTAIAVLLLVLMSAVVAAAPVVAASAPNAGVSAPEDAVYGHAGGTGDCSYPVSTTDATGTEVTVEGSPNSVVALGASTAQTVWELDAEAKVVGVSQFATYLEGAEDAKVLTEGFPATIRTEAVIDLDPDLVLAANVYPNESLDQLRENGITVYKFGAAGSIEDVYAKTERIGHFVGACEAAKATVPRCDRRSEPSVKRSTARSDPTCCTYRAVGSRPDRTRSSAA